MKPDKPAPGQESVWDYPRPPRLEPSTKTVCVYLADQLIVQTTGAYRVLETSHPPSWYLPRADTDMKFLTPTRKSSFCEWKGLASYFTARVGDQTVENGIWTYESPNPTFAPIRNYLAFYPNRFACFVDDEKVTPQPGDFYAGWITRDVVGPFKGIPGSWGW